MANTDCSYLIFDSKQYEIPDQFKKSLEISREIYCSLMRNECKYEVQSKVSEEVFQIFHQYVVDGTTPEIHVDNIYELNQLAREFQISELLELIENMKKRWQEFEKYLEKQVIPQGNESQENPNIDRMIRNLCLIIETQANEIKELKNKFELYIIKHQNQMDEKETQRNNEYKDIIKQEDH